MAPTPANQLSIDQALKDGWAAFQRSPWAFVGFALLSGFLWYLAALIPIPIVNNIVTTLVVLWATVGVVRGAWIALEGGRPRFDDFTRLEWSSLWRLFSRQFVLNVLIGLIVIAAAGLIFTLIDGHTLFMDLINTVANGSLSEAELEGEALTMLETLTTNAATNPVVWLVVLLASVLGLYLQVNQTFIGLIALIDGRGPIAAIRHGMTIVNKQWWGVLGLLLLQSLILLIGFVACCVGLLAAVPVCVCINTAAYRQLFGTDDQAGLLA